MSGEITIFEVGEYFREKSCMKVVHEARPGKGEFSERNFSLGSGKEYNRGLS